MAEEGFYGCKEVMRTGSPKIKFLSDLGEVGEGVPWEVRVALDASRGEIAVRDTEDPRYINKKRGTRPRSFAAVRRVRDIGADRVKQIPRVSTGRVRRRQAYNDGVVGDKTRTLRPAGQKPVHHVDRPEEAAAHLAFLRERWMGGWQFAIQIQSEHHRYRVSYLVSSRTTGCSRTERT